MVRLRLISCPYHSGDIGVGTHRAEPTCQGRLSRRNYLVIEGHVSRFTKWVRTGAAIHSRSSKHGGLLAKVHTINPPMANYLSVSKSRLGRLSTMSRVSSDTVMMR